MFQLVWKKKTVKSFKASLNNQKSKNLQFEKIGLMMWEEHCVECGPPECYKSCSLYVPREDQNCARFVNGIVPVKLESSGDGYAAHIILRKWAKLESPWTSNPKMFGLTAIRAYNYGCNLLEIFFITSQRYLCKLGLSLDFYDQLNSSFHKLSRRLNNSHLKPEDYLGLFFEIFSYEKDHLDLQLEISTQNSIVYRNSISLDYGWNQAFIRKESLPPYSDKSSLIKIWNPLDKNIEILITWAHQVSSTNVSTKNFLGVHNEQNVLEKIKCVVFDLDNTIWNGIVGDDDVVELFPNVIPFLDELENRGIICSIASKNDYKNAWSQIKKFGLDKYFLFSQIHWEAKDISIKNIAKEMNIGLNSIAFIDDSIFERNLVLENCPGVRVYDEVKLSLLDLNDFKIDATEQTLKRKESYISERARQKSFSQTKKSLKDFLRGCNMKIEILPIEMHFDRCLELMQRTNQFNISGKKYNSKEFQSILSKNNSFCWRVIDRYGDYGIVGLMIYEIENKAVRVKEFTLSCRVASKYVEEELLNWFLRELNQQITKLIIIFNDSGRNKPIKDKFFELGFVQEASTTKKENQLVIDKDQLFLRESILEVSSFYRGIFEQ